MDMSDPFREVVPRKLTASELASAIMQDIAAELDAAFLYQAHIDATDDERAKKILAHIRDEEKQHAAEFLVLLKILDPGMAENMQIGSTDAGEMLSELSGTGMNRATGNVENKEPEAKNNLTVGSMMEK